MSQFIGFLSRSNHSRNRPLIQRSDVDIQSAADGGDVFHFLQVICHDGRSTTAQQHVGAVVDGDIVGDVVNQRMPGPYVFQNFFEHANSFPVLSDDLTGMRIGLCLGFDQ